MRLLDLFCGAGGAGMGYHRAGFEVVGVDIKHQKNYPFEFHLGDAFEFLEQHGQEFDVIHASPPCQGYSRTRHLPWLKDRKHPLLIPQIRAALIRNGKPYVIENVADAPLAGMLLHGGMFGLPYRRARLFETNVFFLVPTGERTPVETRGRMFGQRLRRQHDQVGIDSQAIPPAYTEWIGRRLLEALSCEPHLRGVREG